MGRERLASVSQQMGNMLAQEGPVLIAATATIAKQRPVKDFVHSGTTATDTSLIMLLQKLKPDSTWVSVALLNAAYEPMIEIGHLDLGKDHNLATIIRSLSPGADQCKAGKLYGIRDSIYYPVVAAVADKDQVIGYLLRWRLQLASPEELSQVSELLGTNAILYVGNRDESLWTNLIHPVAPPAADTAGLNNFFEFTPPGAARVIAIAQPIPNSPWKVLVGFPKNTILAASGNFLNSAILIGGILTLIGILIAWIMSRSITHPLQKLTAAASAMAQGDHSSTVPGNRRDELGKLARAFNAMTIHVQTAQSDLEKKVQDRTTQLQTVNKELEAFSYSVSHDLRAPLRGISGYAAILKEDYGSKLDEEANRITDRIVSNAKMMGQLIDSLISFSKMGTKEPVLNTIDMTQLAESCMAEVLQQEPPGKYLTRIHHLPACQGDPDLIRQVWLNLIGNAVKYSSRQPAPSIEIGCTAGDTMHTYFIIDNGTGFDMQYAHKLFGVFQRLHSQKDYEGSGIGLAFAKRIILKHQGEITADSVPGEGATFYFSLPAAYVATNISKALSPVR